MYSWSDVFDLTKEFKKSAPWKHISDNNLIAFFDQATDTPIICSVLGNSENTFGLAIYIGREGLMSLVNTYLIENDFEKMNILQTQRSLLLSLEDREDLAKEEYKFLKKHEASFRGKKSWPTYTSYRPGYYPWHCNEKEKDIFIQALEIIIQLTKDVKKGLYLPSFPEEEKILFHEWEKGKQASSYTSIYVENLHARMYRPKLALSEFELKKVKRVKKRTPLTIEFSYQYLFTPIQKEEGERPIFPVIVLALNHEDGSLIYHELFDEPIDTEIIQQIFVKTVDSLRAIPQNLIVDEKTEYHMIELVHELDIFDDLRDDLIHTEIFLTEMMAATFGDEEE